MNLKLKKIIDNPWNNVGLIFTVVIILTILTMSAPDLDKAGLGGLANLFFPGILGIFTILVYLITRIFFRKWNWIVTIAGTISIAYISIMLFFDKL